MWKSVAHVIGKLVGFSRFTNNEKTNNLPIKLLGYGLPHSKIISGMTNIITAIMLNHFSMPRTMFFE